MDENVRFRLQTLENDMLDVKDRAVADSVALHDKIDLLRTDISELVAIFKGAKSTLLIAKILGRTTIAVAAFLAAFKFCLYVMSRFPWR